MKRTIVFLILTGMLAGTGFAQQASGNVFNINAGYMNPTDMQGGMFFGFMWGTAVDEAVDLGFGVDVFHKTYSETSQVATTEDEGLTSNTYATEVDYSRTLVPLKFMINVKVPTSMYYGYFIRASLNYNLLFSKEQNYAQDKSQTNRFGGLGWQAAGGFYYQVGSRSTLICDVFYNSGKATRDVEKSNSDLPVTESVNLSGLGFRIGVNLHTK